jgi:hypothetical protein
MTKGAHRARSAGAAVTGEFLHSVLTSPVWASYPFHNLSFCESAKAIGGTLVLPPNATQLFSERARLR